MVAFRLYLRRIGAGERNAKYCNRPICENDVTKSAEFWGKSARLWESVMKSA